MDYGGVVREAWSVSRRTPALWWLGVITAAQVIFYTLIMLILVVPMALIPRLILPLSLSAQGLPAESNAMLGGFSAQAATRITEWVGANWGPLVGGIVAVMAIWVVLGVLDVAAQPGLITQTSAELEGRPSSVGAGMRDGFRLWWRTIGLLAVAALPSLLYLLVMALIMFFTVSLPLYRGQMPNAGASVATNMLASPLSTLTSVISIPLGVLVQLGLRFGVVENREWRPALGLGWQLMKTRFPEVALMYLTLLAVSLIVTIPFGVVVAFIVGVATVVAVSAFAAGTASTGVGVAAVALGLLVVVLLLFAVSVVWFIYQSVAWTLFWRRATGRDSIPAEQRAVTLPTSARVPSASTPTSRM